MNYFKAEFFRLTKIKFNRNAVVYTSITAIIVLLFRLYSPSLNLYREPNGFGLFAYSLRAMAFLWTLFLVFFLAKQYQYEIEDGMTRQILTTEISRSDFARQRWLTSSAFWGSGFTLQLWLIFILAGIFAGYGDIAEQKYIFYGFWQMNGVVILAWIMMAVSIMTLTGFIQLLYLFLGNPATLPALIIMLAIFFAPEYGVLSYLLPGAHISIIPGVIENMSNKLAVDFSTFFQGYAINNLIWLPVIYFLQLRRINSKDFSK